MKTELTQYDQQATDFFSRHGLKIAIKLSNTKTAPWDSGADDGVSNSRNHYRVTISGEKPSKRWARPQKNSITFDFYGSVRDKENGEHPTPYDVLACISSDVHCPATFEDFCAEYGYDEDSRKAEQTFRRANAFARKLRAFFTDAEQNELSEIQ